MNITDYRHLPFGRIPDEVVDACARAACEAHCRGHGLKITDHDWTDFVRKQWVKRVKSAHARARYAWLKEQQDPAKILIDTHIDFGQVVIDAIEKSGAVACGYGYGFDWEPDAPRLIETALREAGWKLTPL